MLDLLLIEQVTKMKLGNNSVEDHPQLSHNRHPSSGWCPAGCWFTVAHHWVTESLLDTSLNPVPNAQVCVYLTVHYICAKKVYYAVMAKCHRQHAAAYRTTQNAFP
jgi:hypothetical protein